MAQSCDPQALSTAAKCFECIPDPQAVQTMLLATIAGGSMDPQVLSRQAECFKCLEGQYLAVQVMLLCTIVNK